MLETRNNIVTIPYSSLFIELTVQRYNNFPIFVSFFTSIIMNCP